MKVSYEATATAVHARLHCAGIPLKVKRRQMSLLETCQLSDRAIEVFPDLFPLHLIRMCRSGELLPEHLDAGAGDALLALFGGRFHQSPNLLKHGDVFGSGLHDAARDAEPLEGCRHAAVKAFGGATAVCDDGTGAHFLEHEDEALAHEIEHFGIPVWRGHVRSVGFAVATHGTKPATAEGGAQ